MTGNLESGLAVNDTEISRALKDIKSVYENLYNILSIDVQRNFVDELANMWACNYAVEFFNNVFKPSFDKLLDNVNAAFANIVESIVSAGVAWAETNGGTFADQGLTLKTNKIDVSGIRENINGVRGINVNAQTIANRLSTISSRAETELTNIINAAETSGFYGSSMPENLVSSLTQIKNEMADVIATLNNDVQQYVNKTAEEYRELATSTAKAFSGE